MKKFLLPLSLFLATMIPACSLVENSRNLEARINSLNVKVERRYHLSVEQSRKVEEINDFYFRQLEEIRKLPEVDHIRSESLIAEWQTKIERTIQSR